MAMSRSQFLAIAKQPPLEGTGWQLRVLAYWDYRTVVTVINDYTALSVGMEVSAPGAGSVSLDLASPFFSTTLTNGRAVHSIFDNEYVFEAWEDGARRFAFLGRNVEEQLVEETGGRQVVISGPGIGEHLKFAVIQRPGWPRTPGIVDYAKNPDGTAATDSNGAAIPIRLANSGTDTVPAYLWRFPKNWPAMRMWMTTFRAAQRRGLLSWITPSFTATKDSAGRAFQYVPTVEQVATREGFQPETPQQDLLDWLDQCTGQDTGTWFAQRLEWFMYPGFRLDVRTKIGVDRSKQVRFFDGQIVTKDRVRSRDKIVNVVTAVDVDGNESIATSALSVSRFARRESRNDTNKNITNPTTRTQLAYRYLDQSQEETSEWTISVPYDQPGRRPFVDYQIGDTICVVRYRYNVISTLENYRVMAMTINVSADSDVPTVELTLQSRYDGRMQELEKRITRLINEPAKFKLQDLLDVSIPAKPAGSGALVWNPLTNRWEVDPTYTPGGGGGSGTGTGPQIYVQPTNPAATSGNTVKAGDFWLETYG